MGPGASYTALLCGSPEKTPPGNSVRSHNQGVRAHVASSASDRVCWLPAKSTQIQCSGRHGRSRATSSQIEKGMRLHGAKILLHKRVWVRESRRSAWGKPGHRAFWCWSCRGGWRKEALRALVGGGFWSGAGGGWGPGPLGAMSNGTSAALPARLLGDGSQGANAEKWSAEAHIWHDRYTLVSGHAQVGVREIGRLLATAPAPMDTALCSSVEWVGRGQVYSSPRQHPSPTHW